MSDILEQADQLYDALEALLSLGIRTASGEAVGTVNLEGLKTDGRTFANALFPKGIPRLPSETLSVGSLYDTSQACARMASSISMTRKDYEGVDKLMTSRHLCAIRLHERKTAMP